MSDTKRFEAGETVLLVRDHYTPEGYIYEGTPVSIERMTECFAWVGGKRYWPAPISLDWKPFLTRATIEEVTAFAARRKLEGKAQIAVQYVSDATLEAVIAEAKATCNDKEGD
jgi:hypothetical protein